MFSDSNKKHILYHCKINTFFSPFGIKNAYVTVVLEEFQHQNAP